MNSSQEIQHYKTDILKIVDTIQCQCFGGWKNKKTVFPIPLPEAEAGPSRTSQRRYLWTDSFGILTFISQAKLLKEISQENDKVFINMEEEYRLSLSAVRKSCFRNVSCDF